MNDAASVALLKAVNNLSDSADLSFTTLLFLLTFFVYVFVASFALGLTSGLAIAWMMKHLGPFSQPQEVSLVGALAFLCYLIAELLGLSGILALFFCGMAVSHYALQHVSRPSQAALLNAFRTLSYLLEGFIFLYVGRDALDPVKWANASFLQTVMLLVIITTLVALSRAAFVFPYAPCMPMFQGCAAASSLHVFVGFGALVTLFVILQGHDIPCMFQVTLFGTVIVQACPHVIVTVF